MRRYLRSFVLVCGGALFLLGTSRPLEKKEMVGRLVHAPATIQMVGQAQAIFGENVNNQGCFADQRLDFQASFTLHNQGKKPLIVREQEASLQIDGAFFPLRQQFYFLQQTKHVVPWRTVTIHPGKQGLVRLYSYAFLPKKSLHLTQQIRVRLPLPGGPFVVAFESIPMIKTGTGFPKR